MKLYRWDDAKDAWLRRVRGISFEDILFHIEAGDILDILAHTNPGRYPGQRIFVIRVEDYAYLVPFEETADEIRLKTVIPSRKATRDYLGGE